MSTIPNGLSSLFDSVKEKASESPNGNQVINALRKPSETELWFEGKEKIEKELNILIQPSVEADANCYLKVLGLGRFKGLPGVNPTEGFKHGEPLSVERWMEIQSKWRTALEQAGLSVEACEFWLPVMVPTHGPRTPPIADYVSRLLKVKAAHDEQMESLQGFNQGIAINPTKALERGQYPRAFIPEREWFSEDIQKLKAGDIITLFPEAELELFSLFVGRVACGRSQSKPVGEDVNLSHQFRKMAIVYGADPQTGKSYTIGRIINALKMCGYKVAPYRGIGERFNQGQLATADLAYKDDTTQANLGAMLESETLKMLISGASIIAENKGKDAFPVSPMAAILAITNTFDQSTLWKLDPGVISRLAVLYTYSHLELSSRKVHIKGVGDSPDPRAYPHLNWLAKELATTPEVLMLWFVRLSADKFLSEMNYETLDMTVTKLTDRLQFPVAYRVLPNVVLGMLFSYSLKTGKLPVPLSNKNTLALVLRHFSYVVADPNAHLIRQLLKEDWIQQGRPPVHPWRGVRLVSKVSISNLITKISQTVTGSVDMDEMIRLCFGVLQSNENLSIGNSPYFMKLAWEDVYGSTRREYVLELANSIKEQHRSLPNTEILSESIEGESLHSLAYTDSIGFDPSESAQTLQELWEGATSPIDLRLAYDKFLQEKGLI